MRYNWLEKATSLLYNIINPNDCIILSHADHDGFSSSVLLNAFFLKKYGYAASIMYPTKMTNYEKILSKIKFFKPKFLIIVDSPLSIYKKALEDILNHTYVLNFDHHDILDIKHQNYYDFNPHIWGIDFLNSSGLVWKILKKIEGSFFEERCWVAGIGAIQDYCIEDNHEMFELIRKLNLIEDLNLASLVDSKLMQIAKMVRASISTINPQYTYNILLNACMNNAPEYLYDDVKLKKAYENFKKQLNEAYNNIKADVFLKDKIKFKFYDMKEFDINLISDFCEREKEEAIYIAYKKNRISFRALFINYDVRVLVRYFGGGGANPRAAGAKTRDSYKSIIKRVLDIHNQRSIQDFWCRY